ncbi:glycine cleavage T C-terminal barrel domain-containing protein, partial [Amylibacter marinus]|uniref:glycine cleavage T C-terminal barrel domain-containing protein n=1 Tax=Amylibacter marinus TaxID=1475483 RepID=UPI0024E09A65
SFSGELAYEIHIPNASLYAVYLALRGAGKAHGMRLFGARAVDSMRLEMGFLHWKADLITEYDPFETGLQRFVKLDKGDFIGKAALQQRHASSPTRQMVTLRIDSKTAPAHAGASLMRGADVVGSVTSGEWGHRVGLNIAYAFVMPDRGALGARMHLDACGTLVEAEVIAPNSYDPSFARLRS